METSSAQTAIHISEDTSQLKQLRRKLRELDQQLDRFASGWFSAPEALLPNLTAEAEAKDRQRERVTEQLRQAEVASQPIDIDAEVEQIAQRVWMLAEELSRDKPARLREPMSRLVECVDVSFNEQRRGKKREYRPVGGRILFRGESLGFASRGDWIWPSDLLVPKHPVQPPKTSLFPEKSARFSSQLTALKRCIQSHFFAVSRGVTRICHSAKRYVPVWLLGRARGV